MAKKRDIKIEAAIWRKFGTIVNSKKWMKDLLGNTARYMHRKTAYKFQHPKHRISPLTWKLRKAQGIGSRQAGIATGKLAKAIGDIKTRDSRKPLPFYHPSVRYTRTGYIVGENYPEYTKYYELGWKQTFTKKQAGYLAWKTGNYKLRGMAGKTYSAPARPFNYLTTSEVTQAQKNLT